VILRQGKASFENLIRTRPPNRYLILNSPSTKPLCGYSGGFLLLHRSLLAEASLMRTPQSFILSIKPLASFLSPSILKFWAALMSRSWCVSQSGHLHSRTERERSSLPGLFGYSAAVMPKKNLSCLTLDLRPSNVSRWWRISARGIKLVIGEGKLSWLSHRRLTY